MKVFGRIGLFVLVIGLGLLGGLPAQADLQGGNGELGFDFGFTDFDSDIPGANSGGARFDLRAGYMFTNLFQLEGQIGYGRVGDEDLGTAFANAVFNFRAGPRLTPYFLVGAGAARLEVGSMNDNGVGGQVAGGFRAFGSEGRIGMRMELGAMVLDVFDETATQVSFTVGFTFGLGKRHAHRHPRPRKSFTD